MPILIALRLQIQLQNNPHTYLNSSRGRWTEISHHPKTICNNDKMRAKISYAFIIINKHTYVRVYMRCRIQLWNTASMLWRATSEENMTNQMACTLRTLVSQQWRDLGSLTHYFELFILCVQLRVVYDGFRYVREYRQLRIKTSVHTES